MTSSSRLTYLRRVWDQLQDSTLPPSKEDMARWEAEFNQLMNADREDTDYGDAMQGAWNDAVANDLNMKFDDEGLPILGEYIFGKSDLRRD